MAIGNVTPDSFYASSRLTDVPRVRSWARSVVEEGADILDIGGCSTRPGSTPATEEEEWSRIAPALEALRMDWPEMPLSLDTFRPGIARRALEQFGPMIINDISGGCDDMYALVRHFAVPYVWTLRGDLSLPAEHPEMNSLDLILDPGFGFTGSTEEDYRCMRTLDSLQQYHRPVLVGISRKSMLWRPLGLTPDTCLAPTQALHLYALEHGADILRVHDVAAAQQTVTLWKQISNIKSKI